MTYKQVATMIAGIGLPFAYDHFDDENTPGAPPFICFYYGGSDDMAADNVNFQRIRPLTLELYTDNKDFSLEETVEAALNGAGVPVYLLLFHQFKRFGCRRYQLPEDQTARY